MNEIIQWAMGALAVAGFVVLWRLDATSRFNKKMQQEVRRNVTEQKLAVDRLKQYADDWGNLNQKRAAMNDRYDDTLAKIRQTFGIKDD